MATFDLLGLEPHKVSRDLTGYITYIYGEPQTGKTTLASQAGTALIPTLAQFFVSLRNLKLKQNSSLL